jgi:hypothetical protein
MKKITFLIALTLMSFSASAQVYLNGGFETWVANTETPHTYQMPQRWLTIDVVSTFFNELFGNNGYVVNSVSQTSTAHSGNYAVQMSVAVSNFSDTVAGAILYCNTVNDLLADKAGLPFASRPANYTGWYKWNRVGGDTCGVNLIMTKWNTTTQSRDTVAYEENVIINAASGWTTYSFPISYIMNIFPDSIFVVAGNLTQRPHVGSVFTVDDFGFSGTVPIGINESPVAVASVSVFPNPFAEQTTLNIKDVQLSKGKIELYDVLGNKVRSMENLSGNNFIISREGLPAGIYFYAITEENVLLATGKINCQ